MSDLLMPGSPEYLAGCEAATKATGVTIRYLAQYTHGATAIGLILRCGEMIEIPLRRKESKLGVTGGYLRLEHLLDALRREWTEEEIAKGEVLGVTVEDIIRYARFVGFIDIVGHTVADQGNLRELTLILLVDLPPELKPVFTPSAETSAKVLTDFTTVKNDPSIFRADGEYQMILRAAAHVAGYTNLPRLTTDPLGEGVYLNIVDGSQVKL